MNYLKKKFWEKKIEITQNCDKCEKGGNVKNKNYRLVSIWSNFPKVFGRLIYNQLNKFMETKYSKFRTGSPRKSQYTIRNIKNGSNL